MLICVALVTLTTLHSSRPRSTTLVSWASVRSMIFRDCMRVNLTRRALGYTQALRPGVKASIGLALDTQRLNETNPSGPAHKVGAHFVFEG